MDNKLIERINFLAKKKRQSGLTAEEQQEQQELYKEYLGAVRGSLKRQIENIDVEAPDGTVVPLKDSFRTDKEQK